MSVSSILLSGSSSIRVNFNESENWSLAFADSLILPSQEAILICSRNGSHDEIPLSSINDGTYELSSFAKNDEIIFSQENSENILRLVFTSPISEIKLKHCYETNSSQLPGLERREQLFLSEMPRIFRSESKLQTLGFVLDSIFPASFFMSSLSFSWLKEKNQTLRYYVIMCLNRLGDDIHIYFPYLLNFIDLKLSMGYSMSIGFSVLLIEILRKYPDLISVMIDFSQNSRNSISFYSIFYFADVNFSQISELPINFTPNLPFESGAAFTLLSYAETMVNKTKIHYSFFDLFCKLTSEKESNLIFSEMKSSTFTGEHLPEVQIRPLIISSSVDQSQVPYQTKGKEEVLYKEEQQKEHVEEEENKEKEEEPTETTEVKISLPSKKSYKGAITIGTLAAITSIIIIYFVFKMNSNQVPK